MKYDGTISQASVDLTVAEEVSSAAYYSANYTGVSWPGSASGCTIAIGYDLGYCSPDEFDADWGTRLTPEAAHILRGCIGLKGEAAHGMTQHLKGVINIPWGMAMAVFEHRDVPRWIANVQRALPNTDELNGDCLGALFSLTFNRGASYSAPGDRYAEMRAIKANMAAKEFEKIPAEFRAMKRCWPEGSPNHKGLTARREHEAVLFEKGLAAMKAGVAVPTIAAPHDTNLVAPHSVNATPEEAPHPGSSGEFWSNLLKSGDYHL